MYSYCRKRPMRDRSQCWYAHANARDVVWVSPVMLHCLMRWIGSRSVGKADPIVSMCDSA
eukprot:12897516-Prorocentrum_lima.AAC.1